MESYPKISIITVVLNGELEIKDTLESIINQEYPNREIIVIDGGSTDNTQKIIEGFKESIDTYICEEDRGVYNAMNKGILFSKGDWIIFMNSGDGFYSPKVLNVFSKGVIQENSDVVYGGVLTKFKDYSREIKPRDLQTITRSLPFNHQASFVKRTILNSRMFDENYKLAADYNLFYFLFREGRVFQEINQIIATVDSQGLSSHNSLTTSIELFKIYRYHNSDQQKPSLLFIHFFRIFKQFIKEKSAFLRMLNFKYRSMTSTRCLTKY